MAAFTHCELFAGIGGFSVACRALGGRHGDGASSVPVRYLTAREAGRMQGFPESFFIPLETDPAGPGVALFGNAVSVRGEGSTSPSAPGSVSRGYCAGRCFRWALRQSRR